MFENTFSKSRGFVPSPVQGQPGSLTKEAQTRLWNIFFTDFWTANLIQQQHSGPLVPRKELSDFLKSMWVDYWPGRLDQYPGDTAVLDQIGRNIGGPSWHLFFDMFQEIFQNERIRSRLQAPEATEQKIREALIRENTAYTFVGGFFVERMTSAEVQSIDQALRSPIEGIREHIATALRFLSDRDNPDYRNSIKESISAVEATCNHLTHQNNATLQDALNTLHSRKPLRQTFKDALSKLYAWTSDERGIRHALMESENVEQPDAQFMLVTCSAFVNYLFER